MKFIENSAVFLLHLPIESDNIHLVSYLENNYYGEKNGKTIFSRFKA